MKNATDPNPTAALSWPEQEVILKWLDKHGIEVSPWQVLELSSKVSVYRIEAEKKAEQLWKRGVRIIQLLHKEDGDTVNKRDVLLALQDSPEDCADEPRSMAEHVAQALKEQNDE